VKQTTLKFHAAFVEPMLAVPVKELPEGPAWEYELKLDGYRALALKSDGHARLYSRNGKDFSRRFPTVVRAIEALPDETLIDGEVVAVDENGRPSFSSLQNLDRTAVFYAFDVPTLAGEDLKRRTLNERRKVLRKLTRTLDDPIRFSETLRPCRWEPQRYSPRTSGEIRARLVSRRSYLTNLANACPSLSRQLLPICRQSSPRCSTCGWNTDLDGWGPRHFRSARFFIMATFRRRRAKLLRRSFVRGVCDSRSVPQLWRKA
jgi:hypothetical protein